MTVTIEQLISDDKVRLLEDEYDLFAHPENIHEAVLGVITQLLATDSERFVSSGVDEDSIRTYLKDKLDLADGE